jgi:hypothetical protein
MINLNIPSKFNSVHVFTSYSFQYYHTYNQRPLKSLLAWNFPTKSPYICLILFIRATYNVQPRTIFRIVGPKLWSNSLCNVPSILLFLTSDCQIFYPVIHSQCIYDIYIYITILQYSHFLIKTVQMQALLPSTGKTWNILTHSAASTNRD